MIEIEAISINNLNNISKNPEKSPQKVTSMGISDR